MPLRSLWNNIVSVARSILTPSTTFLLPEINIHTHLQIHSRICDKRHPCFWHRGTINIVRQDRNGVERPVCSCSPRACTWGYFTRITSQRLKLFLKCTIVINNNFLTNVLKFFMWNNIWNIWKINFHFVNSRSSHGTNFWSK